MGSAQRLSHLTQHGFFTDARGVTWTVEQRSRPVESGIGTELVLIFQSVGAFRCVRVYPNDWFDLDDTALEKLSWKT